MHGIVILAQWRYNTYVIVENHPGWGQQKSRSIGFAGRIRHLHHQVVHHALFESGIVDEPMRWHLDTWHQFSQLAVKALLLTLIATSEIMWPLHWLDYIIIIIYIYIYPWDAQPRLVSYLNYYLYINLRIRRIRIEWMNINLVDAC